MQTLTSLYEFSSSRLRASLRSSSSSSSVFPGRTDVCLSEVGVRLPSSALTKPTGLLYPCAPLPNPFAPPGDSGGWLCACGLPHSRTFGPDGAARTFGIWSRTSRIFSRSRFAARSRNWAISVMTRPRWVSGRSASWRSCRCGGITYFSLSKSPLLAASADFLLMSPRSASTLSLAWRCASSSA